MTKARKAAGFSKAPVSHEPEQAVGKTPRYNVQFRGEGAHEQMLLHFELPGVTDASQVAVSVEGQCLVVDVPGAYYVAVPLACCVHSEPTEIALDAAALRVVLPVVAEIPASAERDANGARTSQSAACGSAAAGRLHSSAHPVTEGAGTADHITLASRALKITLQLVAVALSCHTYLRRTSQSRWSLPCRPGLIAGSHTTGSKWA